MIQAINETIETAGMMDDRQLEVMDGENVFQVIKVIVKLLKEY